MPEGVRQGGVDDERGQDLEGDDDGRRRAFLQDEGGRSTAGVSEHIAGTDQCGPLDRRHGVVGESDPGPDEGDPDHLQGDEDLAEEGAEDPPEPPPSAPVPGNGQGGEC